MHDLRLTTAPASQAADSARSLERHGGWWLSFALHVLLFAMLFVWKLPPLLERARQFEPIRVVLADLPAQAPPSIAVTATALEQQPATADTIKFSPAGEVQGHAGQAPRPEPRIEVVPPEVIATSAPATPENQADVAAWLNAPSDKPAEIDPTAPPPPALAAATDSQAGPDNLRSSAATAAPKKVLADEGADGGDPMANLTPEQLALVNRLQQEGAALARQNNAHGARGSSEVAQQLRLAGVDVKAQQVLFSSRGAKEGAVRELDISGIPPAETHRVLERYGIRIITTVVRGHAAEQGGFLSSAQTRAGRFVNTDASGPVEMFQYGPAAITKMMQLETEALKAEGYDPDNARVIRVVFGVAPTTGGYDMAVRRLEVEPIPNSNRPAPKELTAKAQPTLESHAPVQSAESDKRTKSE